MKPISLKPAEYLHAGRYGPLLCLIGSSSHIKIQTPNLADIERGMPPVAGQLLSLTILHQPDQPSWIGEVYVVWQKAVNGWLPSIHHNRYFYLPSSAEARDLILDSMREAIAAIPPVTFLYADAHRISGQIGELVERRNTYREEVAKADADAHTLLSAFYDLKRMIDDLEEGTGSE